MTNYSYFNIFEIKLSITSLFSVEVMSYSGASDMIYNVVIDSSISEILKYEPSVIESFTEILKAVLFTPSYIVLFLSSLVYFF